MSVELVEFFHLKRLCYDKEACLGLSSPPTQGFAELENTLTRIHLIRHPWLKYEHEFGYQIRALSSCHQRIER